MYISQLCEEINLKISLAAIGWVVTFSLAEEMKN